MAYGGAESALLIQALHALPVEVRMKYGAMYGRGVKVKINDLVGVSNRAQL